MFTQDLESLLPELRAYARMLCADRDLADDIVQNACLKAWKARNSFDPQRGSFKAWMFVITRNEFFQMVRKSKRMENHAPSAFEAWLTQDCQLTNRAEYSDAIRQLFTLNQDQRDVFILVVAVGYSYEEAAKILNCSVGTVKSRINRAREKLIEKLTKPSEVTADLSESPIQNGFLAVQDVLGYAQDLIDRAA